LTVAARAISLGALLQTSCFLVWVCGSEWTHSRLGTYGSELSAWTYVETNIKTYSSTSGNCQYVGR
jgi:hypothetical protein